MVIERVARGLLGRHILGRAENRVRAGMAVIGGFDQLGQAEVGEPRNEPANDYRRRDRVSAIRRVDLE